MRALKVLVAVMGVLLVAGFAVVVVTIVNRASRSPGAETAKLASFGTKTVTLPADSLVLEVHGAGDRIVLRLELKDGSEMLLVLNAATGTELGRINLQHEKPP